MMADNKTLLNLTKDIAIAMINNNFIANPVAQKEKTSDNINKAITEVYEKLSELNEKPQNIC